MLYLINRLISVVHMHSNVLAISYRQYDLFIVSVEAGGNVKSED